MRIANKYLLNDIAQRHCVDRQDLEAKLTDAFGYDEHVLGFLLDFTNPSSREIIKDVVGFIPSLEDMNDLMLIEWTK